jgi:hypothetical protein
MNNEVFLNAQLQNSPEFFQYLFIYCWFWVDVSNNLKIAVYG